MKYLNASLRMNLLLSTIILIIWVSINYFLFYPSTNELGYLFSLSIIYIISAYVMLGVGALVLLLRFIKVLKSGHHFFVVLSMEFNLVIGAVSIVLYLFHEADLVWVNKSLLNLLIGTLLLGDCVLFKEKKAMS